MPVESPEEGASTDNGVFVWPPKWWVSRHVNEIQFEVQSSNCDVKRQPVSSLNMARRFLRINVPSIDNLLGGFPSGMINEVTGEAGSGKTQLGFTLTAEALIHMLINSSKTSSQSANYSLGDFAVYYIYTEGTFPVKRLRDILESRIASGLRSGRIGVDPHNAPCHDATALSVLLAKKLLKCVFVEQISDDHELWTLLCNKMIKLIGMMDIRLVIVDSITSIFRVPSVTLSRDTDIHNSVKSFYIDRAVNLFRTSAALKRVSHETDCCIVCMNQICVRGIIPFNPPSVFHGRTASITESSYRE